MELAAAHVTIILSKKMINCAHQSEHRSKFE
jgi:hypothetical protein